MNSLVTPQVDRYTSTTAITPKRMPLPSLRRAVAWYQNLLAASEDAQQQYAAASGEPSDRERVRQRFCGYMLTMLAGKGTLF